MTTISRPHVLRREDCAVLVIDVQERLCAAMDPDNLARVLSRTAALVKGARALGLPVVTTEQYPKGLGATHAALAPLLVTSGPLPVEKLQFSAALPEVLERLAGRWQLLVAGMETHVCVFQSVRDFAARGLLPFVCADAVISRHVEDRAVGLTLCEEAGAVRTTVEAALFDLLGTAGTPEFRQVSAAVK